MAAVLEKVRERRRGKSVSERRDSDDSGRRLSSLIPGRRRSKFKGDQGDLSPSSSNPSLALAGNQSGTSIDLQGSGNSSLLTDDNSDGERHPVRPTLSPHHSHAGYLTLSSPEVHAVQNGDPNDSITTTTPSLGGSTSPIPRIVEPNSESIAAPKQKDRNTSPVGKLKARLSRKQSSTSLDSGTSGSNGEEGTSTPPQLSSTPSLPFQLDATEQTATGNLRRASTSPERPNTPQKRSSTKPRITTGSLPGSPVESLDTPQTLVTPPTPTDFNAGTSTFPRFGAPRISSPTRSLGSKHRRSQSANVPSKLSHSVAPPLTPTIEETKTPGGSLTSGFFSSFLSAAQKAADQFNFTPNVAGGSNEKSRDNNGTAEGEEGGEAVIPGSASQFDLEDTSGQKKPRTVETLGKGDLDFSHLGISESASASSVNSAMDLPLQDGSVPFNSANRAEEEAAHRAVSAAYEKPFATAPTYVAAHARPLSISSTDRLTLGEQTPPRPGADIDSIRRTGSVRSKLSGRRRRHRASSATAGTSNSIGAALAASATGLANPTINGVGHRLTGFAVASSKRNKDFHQLFRSVPEDDYLIEDYSAALQRDILLHGRLYVSEGYICFSSNILGWVTNLVISFDEVVSVEKKSTAVIFPNAIVIQTVNARNTFASFVARDSTYELLIGIWKISHPNLKSSLNGVTLDNAGTGDKTYVADPDISDGEGSESDSDDDVYDEDADNDSGSFNDTGLAPSIAGSEFADSTISRKPSASNFGNGALQPSSAAPKGVEGTDAAAGGGTTDFPGPSTHEPTQCSDEHYDRPIADSTLPAPLGKIYSLMFGPASSAFMRKWLVEDQKSRELNYPEDKTGIDNEHKSLSFDYIKPLSAPVGPKQTKCNTTNTVLAFDLERAVTIDCTTTTPDVPNGNIFTVRTRYCLMWAPGNSTRVVVNCTIEWTAKSWLKGPIEKGANDGQIDYVKSLVAALNQQIAARSPGKGAGKKGKKKGKRDTTATGSSAAQNQNTAAAVHPTSDWGIFQPLAPLLGLLKPFLTPHVMIAVLFVLLMYSWYGPGKFAHGPNVGFLRSAQPDRLAAYEEIWRREESDLWHWLEDRVGLDGGYAPGVDSNQKILTSKTMGKKLQDERMTQQQMDDAIRVTEERLDALKEAVARKKNK